MSQIKRVVLYKHGVGHFERQARITGDGEVRLAFRTEEMNDVLKSLTVYDSGGGAVSSVSYDNKKPISKLLADISLDLPEAGGNVAILSSLRGAEVAVATGSRQVEGQIVGVDRRMVVLDGQTCDKYYLTVFDEKGRLQNFDFDEINNVSFLDQALQDDMRFFFTTVFSAKKQDAKALKVFSRGEGERTLSISYVVECPVWKTSYRMALSHDNEGLLQGWAMVDNPQDEDWKGVELSLVSGLPISFVHDLYSPRYLKRKEVEVEREAAAGPVMTESDLFSEGALFDEAAMPVAMAAPAPAGAPPAPLMMRSQAMGGRGGLAQSAAKVQTVTQKAGQLFEYKIDRPVTVLRNQSALVPIVNSPFEGGKKLLYKEAERAENPFAVVDFKNTTGLTLEGGPVTIYEGDIYAGEAMMDTLGPGEERMLPYSVALEVEAKVEREVHTVLVDQRVGDGVWSERRAQYRDTTYRFVNKGDKPHKVVVEHPLSQAELVNTPKPISETRNFWRFMVEVQANGKETLEVHEKTLLQDTLILKQLDPPQVLARIEGLATKLGSSPVFLEMRELAESVVKNQNKLQNLANDAREKEQGQARIRENLKSLGNTEEERTLRARYVKSLDADETELNDLKLQMVETKMALQKAREAFYSKAKQLTMEKVFE